MGNYLNVQTKYAIRDNILRDVTNITAQIFVGTPPGQWPTCSAVT